MKEQLTILSDKVAVLSQREKILLLLMGLILIPGIIDFFLLQPLRDSATAWNLQTQKIQERMLSFEQQQADLLTEIANDPAMELERRIAGTDKALDATKQALLAYTDALISPQKMAKMLESMLHERGALQLVSLENLPVTPLFKKQQTASTENQSNDNVTMEDRGVFGLYRHGIKLVFKGNYMTTMNYLQSLEALPWKFYWQHFDYEVQEYPRALITLNIYTLSTSKWWIGDDGAK